MVMHIFRKLCGEDGFPTTEQRLQRPLNIPEPMMLLLGNGSGDFPEKCRAKAGFRSEYRKQFFDKFDMGRGRSPWEAMGPNLPYFAQFSVNRYSCSRARDFGGLCLFCVDGSDTPQHVASCAAAIGLIPDKTGEDDALLAYLQNPVLDEVKRDMPRVGQLARDLIQVRRSRLGLVRTIPGPWPRPLPTSLRRHDMREWRARRAWSEDAIRRELKAVGAHMHEWSSMAANPMNSHHDNDCLFAAVAYLLGYSTRDPERPMSQIARQLRHTASAFLEHNKSAVSDNRDHFGNGDRRVNVDEAARALARGMARNERSSFRELLVLEALFDCSFDTITMNERGGFAYRRAAEGKRCAGVVLLFDGHWRAVVPMPPTTPSRPVMV
jgi:hypothetical protein